MRFGSRNRFHLSGMSSAADIIINATGSPAGRLSTSSWSIVRDVVSG